MYEFAPDAFAERVCPDARALVRDADRWSQLVPVAPGDAPTEPLRLWSFHFPPGLDNSGLVGWLATHVKRATGSGVLVVCGQNARRGGIYDYWGCPAAVGDEVLAAVAALRAPATALRPTPPRRTRRACASTPSIMPC